MDGRKMMVKMFAETFRADLMGYLESADAIGKPFPVCPDVEELWPKVGESYMPDAMREFNDYPVVVFGWMMYVGMAVAKFWHEDWERYSKIDDVYGYIKSQTDFDHLDEYICFEILGLNKVEAAKLEKLVGECGARTDNCLLHLNVEPGTKGAFTAFVAALHQMYLMGMAVQLKRMGYEMKKIG